jgi:thiosulfate/3-mercaptopyruvate sulfurtransferase
VRYQLVDCRWELGDPGAGRRAYLAGHVPGASFLDVDRDLAAPPGAAGRHPLPASDDFARAASRAGIGPGVLVVAYGSLGGAERLWWLLRHFGHDDCAVLAGGIDVWLGRLRAGEEEAEPAAFEPRERSGDTIGPDELAARLDDPRLVVVDARLPERFRGEPNPIDRVPGRIPGAVNAPWPEPPSRRRRCRRATWSPTAARASQPASSSTGWRSPAARAASTRARGASGSSEPTSRGRTTEYERRLVLRCHERAPRSS